MSPQKEFQKGTGTPAIQPGTKVAIAATTTQLYAGNDDAISIRVHNPSTTATIWLEYGTGAAVVGEGLPLSPGQTLIEEDYNGRIAAISSSGSVDVALQVV